MLVSMTMKQETQTFRMTLSSADAPASLVKLQKVQWFHKKIRLSKRGMKTPTKVIPIYPHPLYFIIGGVKTLRKNMALDTTLTFNLPYITNTLIYIPDKIRCLGDDVLKLCERQGVIIIQICLFKDLITHKGQHCTITVLCISIETIFPSVYLLSKKKSH